MSVIRKNYCYGEITQKQIDELKKKLGVSSSDILRRAVESYWELKIKK